MVLFVEMQMQMQMQMYVFQNGLWPLMFWKPIAVQSKGESMDADADVLSS